MTTESLEDAKSKKEKKDDFYSFLDADKTQSEEQAGETNAPEEKHVAVELNLTAARKPGERKKGSYSFLEGVEEEAKSDELSTILSKREAKSALKSGSPRALEKEDASAYTDVKLGGLLGKVLSGELKPTVE